MHTTVSQDAAAALMSLPIIVILSTRHYYAMFR